MDVNKGKMMEVEEEHQYSKIEKKESVSTAGKMEDCKHEDIDIEE